MKGDDEAAGAELIYGVGAVGGGEGGGIAGVGGLAIDGDARRGLAGGGIGDVAGDCGGGEEAGGIGLGLGGIAEHLLVLVGEHGVFRVGDDEIDGGGLGEAGDRALAVGIGDRGDRGVKGLRDGEIG